MKKLLLASFLGLSSLTLLSFTPALQLTKVSPATIKVTWVKEVHDFGDITQGKPVSVEFLFTNSGNEPLLIADVATSCGCTASDYSKEPIAPGQSSKIKVSYNAAAMGAFTKAITVNFQDAAAQKVLTIKGVVK
ncbi:MAG: hypothetical protein RL172_3223 [Bacteroidota bacterium]